MKICPTCRKNYSDDSLNFCLEDGSVLVVAGGVPEETLVMNQPRPTDPSPGGVRPTASQQTWPGAATPPAQYSMQPKRSSKGWLWAVGILGLVLLLCGGGGIGLILLGYVSDSNSSRKTDPIEKPTPAPAPSTPPFDSSAVDTIDLSQWVKDFSVWGTTEYVGDEFMMSSKQKGYYYVLVAPEDYKTDNSTTRVTVRNVNDANSNLGYGLIIHSDPTPLTKDFAFLIDSKKKKYRVVKHEPSKETTVVAWTNSPFINEGSRDNVLEARDKGDSVELYINGQMATTIKNTLSPRGGVPGLYSGDAVKIGFKKLEIAR